MSSGVQTSAHLVRMVNQIAANLAAQGDEVAARETAEHIHRFWDPRMKTAILAVDAVQLSPIARTAIGMLAAL